MAWRVAAYASVPFEHTKL